MRTITSLSFTFALLLAVAMVAPTSVAQADPGGAVTDATPVSERVVGKWGFKLPPEIAEQVAAMEKTAKEHPDDEMAAGMLEGMKMMEKITLEITPKQMKFVTPDSTEVAAYTVVEDGPDKVRILATDAKSGEKDDLTLVISDDGTLTMTKEGDPKALQFTPKKAK